MNKQLKQMTSVTAVWLALGCLSLASAGEETVVLEPAESWHIDHATHHVQGLCVSDNYFWITSVDRATTSGWIYRVDRDTLDVAAERRLVDGARYHPGGMQLTGGAIWVPLAEYRPKSSSTMLKLDPESLETLAEFSVGDHLGAATADGRGNLFAANWDTRQIYRFDETGKHLERVDSPTGVAYQDMEWHDGLLYGTGQSRIEGKTAAIVDVIDPQTWQLKARYRLTGERRSGGSAFGREGFSKHGANFYLLPEDGPDTTVYRFPLPR